ncbi:MAG: TIGR04283 family arsenosugar biosynthesis glycosyltransferase [Cyclobacteriaceae bacterium]
MISIIIPTLNEAQYIANCIADLLIKSTKEVELIVVDAGSKDATLKIVQEMERVVCFTDARLAGKKYASLNKGAELAKGDILIFLDADTFLPKDYQQEIEKTLGPEEVVGGAFEMVFDKNNSLLRLISYVNSVRYNLTKRCYGDQAIFCKKHAFQKVNGYPNKIVLEAAHFCKRLMKVGKFRIVNRPVITSSRRFLEEGVLKTFLFDLYLLSMDNLGFNIDRSSIKYWKKNA